MKRAPIPTPAFVPFTLTIETKDEAVLLASLVGSTNHTVQTALGIDQATAGNVYNHISEFYRAGVEITTE
jgi:hypothetical protein